MERDDNGQFTPMRRYSCSEGMIVVVVVVNGIMGWKLGFLNFLISRSKSELILGSA